MSRISFFLLAFAPTFIFSGSTQKRTFNDCVSAIFSQQKEYANGFVQCSQNVIQTDYPDDIEACFELEEFGHSMVDLYEILCEQMPKEVNQLITNNFKESISDQHSYIQKVTIEKDAKVICFGDIHGSVHSLLRNLIRLKENGVIDNNFELADGYYLVFAGDYADRGRYGAEVWYLLARLKSANPEKVFLLRGNHETKSTAGIYGFKQELVKKYNENIALVMYYLFGYLPIALLIGCEDHYLLACHGGLPVKKDGEGNGSFAMCDEIKSFVQEDHQEKIISMPVDSSSVIKQFLWNDFCDGDGFYKSCRGNDSDFCGIGIGLMETSVFDEYGIQAIVRGHEHCARAVNICECRKEVFKNVLHDNKEMISCFREIYPLDDEAVSCIDCKICTLMSGPEGIGQNDVDGYCELKFINGQWWVCAHEHRLPQNRHYSFVFQKEDCFGHYFTWEKLPEDKKLEGLNASLWNAKIEENLIV